MNWRDIPPLNSLRAFSAVAETGSYSDAGGQLNVTQAAVSQQVKILETWLGFSLVQRSGRGIILTDAGEVLAKDLAFSFSAISRSIESLRGTDAERPVQITTSPAFAAEWLLPRIPEFQALHPEITLMLNPSVEVLDLKPGGIDLAIRFREQDSIEAEGEPFLTLDTAIIGAPVLFSEDARRDPQHLTSAPWLEELGRDDVAHWFARRGISDAAPASVTRMPGNLIMQAVRRGDGITESVCTYFKDDIDAGRLITIHADPGFARFTLVTAPGPKRPSLQTFLNWLRTKATNHV